MAQPLFFSESVLDSLGEGQLEHLLAAFNSNAFRALCAAHIELFTTNLVNLDRVHYENLQAFYEEFSRQQTLLSVWKGLDELCSAIETRR